MFVVEIGARANVLCQMRGVHFMPRVYLQEQFQSFGVQAAAYTLAASRGTAMHLVYWRE